MTETMLRALNAARKMGCLEPEPDPADPLRALTCMDQAPDDDFEWCAPCLAVKALAAPALGASVAAAPMAEMTWDDGASGSTARVGCAELVAWRLNDGKFRGRVFLPASSLGTGKPDHSSLDAAKAGALDLWRAWPTEQCAAAGMVAPVAAAQGSAAEEVKPGLAERIGELVRCFRAEHQCLTSPHCGLTVNGTTFEPCSRARWFMDMADEAKDLTRPASDARPSAPAPAQPAGCKGTAMPDSRCRCAETPGAPTDGPFHWIATCPYLRPRDREIVARLYAQPAPRTTKEDGRG